MALDFLWRLEELEDRLFVVRFHRCGNGQVLYKDLAIFHVPLEIKQFVVKAAMKLIRDVILGIIVLFIISMAGLQILDEQRKMFSSPQHESTLNSSEEVIQEAMQPSDADVILSVLALLGLPGWLLYRYVIQPRRASR